VIDCVNCCTGVEPCDYSETDSTIDTENTEMLCDEDISPPEEDDDPDLKPPLR